MSSAVERNRARALTRAKKPSAAQIRVLRRMIEHSAVIRVFIRALRPTVVVEARRIPHRSYNAMRVAGWIEPTANTCEWRVSDAGRKAAE